MTDVATSTWRLKETKQLLAKTYQFEVSDDEDQDESDAQVVLVVKEESDAQVEESDTQIADCRHADEESPFEMNIFEKFGSPNSFPELFDQEILHPKEKKRKRKLQTEDCTEMSKIYVLCNECETKMTSPDDDQKLADFEFTCRFRKFRYMKLNTLYRNKLDDERSFLEADVDDVRCWTESRSSNKIKLNETEACYVLKNAALQFKKILQNERDFLNKYRDCDVKSPSGWVSWKQATNCREICDECSATIFNFHLFCTICGHTICQRCVERCNLRENKKFDCLNTKRRHNGRSRGLQLAQIIPDSQLFLRTLETLNNQLQMVLQQHRDRDSHGEPSSFVTDEAMPSLACEEPINNCVRSQPSPGVDSVAVPSLVNEHLLNDCTCGVVSLEGCDAAQYCGEYYYGKELLILNDMTNENALNAFQNHWRKFRPVIVRNIDKTVDFTMWTPENLRKMSQKYSLNGSVQDCLVGDVFVDFDVDSFWKGFVDVEDRFKNSLLKLKDWPTDKDFAKELPLYYENFCQALPFPKYSHPDNGVFSLTTHLPENYLKPDLGPKLYCAYEMIDHPLNGSTNLHIDGSDAVNLLMNVTMPKNLCEDEQFFQKILRHLDTQGLDTKDMEQILANQERVGALWTIFKPEDTGKIRLFLEKILPAGNKSDVIHDQLRYVHADLRRQLRDEYDVEGFTFVQMLGDAVFIPAGAAHQVQNLVCCIKMAEDFVSPESINKCAVIDEEFRRLSVDHTNHEDKLQLPNVVVHSIKEAVRVMIGDVMY